MNRRDFLKRAAVGAAVMSAAQPAFARDARAQRDRPNFVFILIDDMGWKDLGCYGNVFHETPNTDRLAAQGMRFTDAYAACPVCSPTRASILSGQYPARIGITDFIPGHWRPYEKLRVPINRHQYLPLECVTFAEALQTRGYTSGVYGKWHLGGREHYPDMQGFDAMGVQRGGHTNVKLFPEVDVPEDPYLAEVLTDEALKFMESNREEPFCLCLHHYAVHIPLEARQALVDKYTNKPKPEGGVNNPIYAAMVEHVDHSVGRVLDKLDELDLADNTVVVFFSDNGGLHQRFDGDGPVVSSNLPLRGEKGTLYEGGIRVPLIVRWPGVIEAGKINDTPVISIDFYPTFLELAEAEAPTDQILDGQSLVPLLTQSGVFPRRAIYWHYPHYHHSSPAGAMRDGDWKVIQFYDEGRLEVYNLKRDIFEQSNFYGFISDDSVYRNQLANWRHSVGAEMPLPNPDYDPARANEWGRHPGRE